MSYFVRHDPQSRHRRGIGHAGRQAKRFRPRVVVVRQVAGCALYADVTQALGTEQALRGLDAGHAALVRDTRVLVVGGLNFPLREERQQQRRQREDEIHRIKEEHTNLPLILQYSNLSLETYKTALTIDEKLLNC